MLTSNSLVDSAQFDLRVGYRAVGLALTKLPTSVTNLESSGMRGRSRQCQAVHCDRQLVQLPIWLRRVEHERGIQSASSNGLELLPILSLMDHEFKLAEGKIAELRIGFERTR